MKMKMYSIFDSAAQAFTTPFFMHNDGLAVRAFQDNVNAGDGNNIALHPEQFTLFRIAEFDDKAASLDVLSAPLSVAIGVELINTDTKKYTDVDMKMVMDKLDELIGEKKMSLGEVK